MRELESVCSPGLLVLLHQPVPSATMIFHVIRIYGRACPCVCLFVCFLCMLRVYFYTCVFLYSCVCVLSHVRFFVHNRALLQTHEKENKKMTHGRLQADRWFMTRCVCQVRCFKFEGVCIYLRRGLEDWGQRGTWV